jgi:hypothetical protein
MTPKVKENLLKEVCDFLNIDRKEFVLKFSETGLDKIAKMWDDDPMKIHSLGYELA